MYLYMYHIYVFMHIYIYTYMKKKEFFLLSREPVFVPWVVIEPSRGGLVEAVAGCQSWA